MASASSKSATSAPIAAFPPRRPRGLSDEQKRQAERRYLAEQSFATIGHQFGVHAETVRRYLHTTSVTLHPGPGTA